MLQGGWGGGGDLVWFTAVSRRLEQRQAHRGMFLRGGITGPGGQRSTVARTPGSGAACPASVPALKTVSH